MRKSVKETKKVEVNNIITQDEIISYLQLANQLKAIENEFEAKKKELFSKLESKFENEDGAYKALLETSARRNIAWKEVCEQHIGKEKVAEIFENAPMKPSTTLRIVDSITLKKIQ